MIDLLAEESDGGCLVVDYKSDRLAGADDLDALVRREYSVQRLVYALAVLRDGAPRVEIAHWFLERPEEWVAAGYTRRRSPRAGRAAGDAHPQRA